MAFTERGRMTAGLVGVLIAVGALAGCSSPGLTGQDLPKGIPAELPVPSGEVSNAVTGAGKTWSFMLEVESKEAQNEALSKLKEAGYSVVGESKQGDRMNYSLTNKKQGINVTLSLTKQDDRYLVLYSLAQVK